MSSLPKYNQSKVKKRDIMSSNDFLNGQMAANFAHHRASADWEAYSNKLKGKLQQAELDFVKAEAGRIGFAHLCKTLTEELIRFDPNNPLLPKEARLQIVEKKVAEKATEMGYVYDIGSGQI